MKSFAISKTLTKIFKSIVMTQHFKEKKNVDTITDYNNDLSNNLTTDILSPKENIRDSIKTLPDWGRMLWVNKALERHIVTHLSNHKDLELVRWSRNWLNNVDMTKESVLKLYEKYYKKGKGIDISNDYVICILEAVLGSMNYTNEKTICNISDVLIGAVISEAKTNNPRISDNNLNEIIKMEYLYQISEALFAERCVNMWGTLDNPSKNKKDRNIYENINNIEEDLPELDWTGLGIFACITILLYLIWNMILYR